MPIEFLAVIDEYAAAHGLPRSVAVRGSSCTASCGKANRAAAAPSGLILASALPLVRGGYRGGIGPLGGLIKKTDTEPIPPPSAGAHSGCKPLLRCQPLQPRSLGLLQPFRHLTVNRFADSPKCWTG